jgi:hypothetical protein
MLGQVCTVISWFHGGETRFTTKQSQQVQKPPCVIAYNKFMADVARKDHLLQMYIVEINELNEWHIRVERCTLFHNMRSLKKYFSL